MSKVEKKEGATMDCGSCGLRLICRNKTYEAYEDHPERTVLQWQNDKGGAHYRWIGPEKFKCVDENGKDIHAKSKDNGSLAAPKVGNGLVQNDLMKDDNETPQSKGKQDMIEEAKADAKRDDIPLDTSTTNLVQNESTLLYKIRKIVTKTLKEFEDDPHGGMIGQFTEIIYKKHFGEKDNE